MSVRLIPRDYQEEAVQSLFRFFEEHREGNPVIGMPTGTGKAFVIAYFMYRALRMYAKQKILVATHVKELVDQNYKEFLELWPAAPAGIYSAGLKRKDTWQKIIFCGIASVVKNLSAFGRVDLVIIDECHLVSTEETTMYRKMITMLKEVNPRLRVIGLTATPWRQGQGRITEGENNLFTHMAIDLTDIQSFNRFIKEGYLLPLISKPTTLTLDVSGVKLLGGEFNEKQLDLAVNKDHITFAALKETLQYAHDRRSWIVFATSIDHAEKIHQMLTHLGVSSRVVHSKMPAGERDKNIQDWKDLKFTAIVNMGVLTTGVNHPALDLIVMLRPTMSTVLWVQMLGRGTRPDYVREGYDLTTIEGRLASIAASKKQYCLVMDFAQNIKRLGPVNDPVIPRKKGDKPGEAPIKICDSCGMYNHISAKYCGGQPYPSNEGCGGEFIFQEKLRKEASSEEVMKQTEAPVVEVFRVQSITCKVHQKPGKPPCVQITYYINYTKSFKTFLFLEHSGLRFKADKWWKRRSAIVMPATCAEAVNMIPNFDVPTHIRVWTNCPHPVVLDECFMGEFENNMPLDDTDIVPF